MPVYKFIIQSNLKRKGQRSKKEKLFEIQLMQ